MALSTKLDQKLIGYITVFENLTKARGKDIFLTEDQLVFIVQGGDAGKAIGRKGHTIQRLQWLMKKRIKVIELSTSAVQFVKNVIDPLRVDALGVRDKTIVISAKDAVTKGKLIGRNGKNLKFLNELLERYFSLHAVVGNL